MATSPLELTTWNHALFENLQQILSKVALQPTTSLVRKLRLRLDEATPWILALTALPGPSAADQQVVQNNAITLYDGETIKIEQDQLTVIDQLSTLLNISQLISAPLVLQASSQQPRYPNRSVPEIATYLFHQYFVQLLDFLIELLRLTSGPASTLHPPFDGIRERVQIIVETRRPVGEAFLADGVLDQLDAIHGRLQRLLSQQRVGGAEYELLTYRVGALRTEQGKLASVLTGICEGGLVGRKQVLKMLDWLRKKDRVDTIVGAVIAALTATLRPASELHDEDPRRIVTEDMWYRDVTFLKAMSARAIQQDWTLPRLREPVKLVVSLFVTSALRQNPDLELDPSVFESFISEAINGEAFQALNGIISRIRQDESTGPTNIAEDSLAQLANRNDPSNDRFVLLQIQGVIETLAKTRNLLRSLKNREEDIRKRRNQSTHRNYSAFLSLAAAVYKRLPPDSASSLWGVQAFTETVLDIRGEYHQSRGFWDLLEAISRGPDCATKAFEKMRGRDLDWGVLLDRYEKHRADIVPADDPFRRIAGEGGKDMGRSTGILLGWTRLLTAVLTDSPIARSTIMTRREKRNSTMKCLFDLISLDILDFELKAALLDAVTTLCVDQSSLPLAMSELELTIFDKSDNGSLAVDGAGTPKTERWLRGLAEAEQQHQTYPVTRAHIRFLTSFLPDLADNRDASSATDTRLTRVYHYATTYVLHQAFGQSGRPISAEEQEELADVGIAYIEKALLGFRIGDLLDQGNAGIIGQIAQNLTTQAGYIVLDQLLTKDGTLSALSHCLDHAVNIASPRPSRINQILLRTMRVFHRILNIQLIYTDVLLVTLEDRTRTAVQTRERSASFKTLDQFFLTHLSNVTAIALLVGDDDLEISLLSTKIIASLSVSPEFSRSDIFRGEYTTAVNRLAGFIAGSDESIRIAQGFTSRLDGDEEDLTTEEIKGIETAVLRGNNKSFNLEALPLVIRSTILDLLVEGTAPETSEPNIAHFLLGFEFKSSRLTLSGTPESGAMYTCLDVLFEQVGEREEGGLGVLIHEHPVLAAKAAKLIYQLYAHPLTGREVMGYAATIENFSAGQLAALPRSCPGIAKDDVKGMGEAISAVGQITTTSDNLMAFLEYQRWTMSTAALETFTLEGRGSSADVLSEALFYGQGGDGRGDTGPALIIDLLSSIDVVWTETLHPDITSRVLSAYTAFPFDQYKRPDLDWYDLDSLSQSLRNFRRERVRQGRLTPEDDKKIAEEAENILIRLAAKNHATDIQLAKGAFLTSWNEGLKVALAMLFKHVSDERQEVVLFELLDALLSRTGRDEAAPGVLEIMCESVVVVMTVLVGIMTEYEGVNLPIERLVVSLLGVLDGITRPGMTENSRGNLYAATTQFLSLLIVTVNIPDDASIAASTVGREPIIESGSSGLRKAVLAAIGSRKERFLAQLCRDALDDRDVWKTECFTLLGAIVGLCHTERERIVVSPVLKEGFLPVFVRGIKDDEGALQECLGPEPENLHAYWVYEAKIGFLLAVAATRRGAEELLDAGLFEILSMCGFVAVQPIGGEAMDEEAALKTINRQHRVLICTLQLLVRALSSLHKSSRTGAGHAISFLNAHRESILFLIRENQQNVTTIGVEESRLIISILAMVVHKVPAEDLRSSNGFGVFHLAVLGLAATFFDRDVWSDNLISQEEASAVEPQILGLSQVILSYFCITTAGLKSGSGYPVFVDGSHRSNGAARYIASAPSLQSAAKLLEGLTEATQELSTEFEGIANSIQDGGDLTDADVAKLANGDLISGRMLSVDTITEAYAGRMRLLHNMVETLMLLIWRHLLYYVNDVRGGTDPIRPDTLSVSFSASIAGSQLEGSRSGAGVVRALRLVGASLRGTLERLEEVEVSTELRKRSVKGEGYYGMLIRRLKGFTDDMSGQGSSEG